MNFGIALALLKAGKRVAREGWNGKGMHIYLVPAGRYPPSTPAGQAIADEQLDGLVPYLPYLAMKTVTGDVVPWLASQTDILGDDWQMVDGDKIDFETVFTVADEASDELAVAGQDGDTITVVVPLDEIVVPSDSAWQPPYVG